MKLLTSLPYLPPIAFFAACKKATEIHIESKEHYQKSSYRNKANITSAQGRITLSIPLQKGKHNKAPIQDVQISYDQAWHTSHWRSIATAYGSSAFFQHYVHLFEPYFTREHPSLFDFNLGLLQIFLKAWRLPQTMHLTAEYVADPSPEFLDLRQMWQTHIQQPFEGYEPAYYPQIFEDRIGFQGNLSALDLLFTMGPEGNRYF